MKSYRYEMWIILLILCLLNMMAPFSFSQNIKEPNVSGQFYSADPKKLSDHIDLLFKTASISPSEKTVEILISPHAGYVYSGPVAAYGFKAVSQKNFKTIVILAPSHFYGFEGISIWKQGGFKTPLGTIAVDEEFTNKLMSMNERFTFDPNAFEQEHSLEVQLPFLQKIYKDFKIVPIIMGQPDFKLCQDLATSLNRLIGDHQDILVLVSTDMSHYHDDSFARKMDLSTLETIKTLDAEHFWKQCRVRKMEMCGYIPVTTAILLAKERNLSDVQILKYANSGDATGDLDRVVGYTSIIISPGSPFPQEAQQKKEINVREEIPSLNHSQKKRLLDIAKQTIHEYVKTGKILEFNESDPRLLETEGAFVTIHRNHKLRGCIGNVIVHEPLYITVRNVAISAATEDPRFPKVTQEELIDISIEISVLSKPKKVANPQEVEVGKHGVIIRQGRDRAGLFLPQVATEWNWDREQFLSNLCSHKLGLSADCWKDSNSQIEVFTAEVFSEKDLKE